MESKGVKIIKNILLRKVELENYAKNISEHNFYDIFPEEDYDFSKSTFDKYFYLGKEECVAILQDYFLLISKVYESQTFSYEHFLSVVSEFIENLESNNVFFNFKTYYGHKMLNNNIPGFENVITKLLNVKLINKQSSKFTEFFIPEIQLKADYNFEFFEFLDKKISQTIYCEEFTFEPILAEDCAKIKNIYENNILVENAPFYLDLNSKYFKYVKPKINEYLLSLLPKECAWSVVDKQGREVAIFVLSPEENNEVLLNIISDCDYLDSKLSYALELIKDYAFNVLGASKIVGKNNNDSIAYSNVATAYDLAKFQPNYDSAVGDNGLTRLTYTYKLLDDDIMPLKKLNSVTPISYSTFSVYKK